MPARKPTAVRAKKPFQSVRAQDPAAPLTAKAAAFVREYLIDMNATAAMQRAGYSAGSRQNSTSLLQMSNVAAAIKVEMDARIIRTGITQDAVIAGIARIAFGDLRRMFAPDGTLKPIGELDDDTAGMLAGIDIDTSTESGRDGAPSATTRTAKIRRADQLKALELLGKHLGMFAEKHEHTGSVSFVIER